MRRLETFLKENAGQGRHAIVVIDEAHLLEDCGATYFACAFERKRRFHRTLVDTGLIDLMPRAQQAR